MFRDEKGFSLMQVMVAAGLLGGLSLVFMQLMKNVGQGQISIQSKSDEIELRTSIRMILNDERYCRVSLAGDGASGPVVFEKIDIDDEATEGLNIALYLSNQAGDTRTLKKYNGENNIGTNDRSKYGKLTIKTLKLIMNNNPGINYTDDPNIHDEIGMIRAVVEKKISSTKTRTFNMDFDVNVQMLTGQSPENSGETRILSCSQYIMPRCVLREASSSTWTPVLPPISPGLALYTTRATVNCLPGERIRLCNDDFFVSYSHEDSKVAPATWTYTDTSCEGYVGMIEGGGVVTSGTYKVRGLCCKP